MPHPAVIRHTRWTQIECHDAEQAIRALAHNVKPEATAEEVEAFVVALSA